MFIQFSHELHCFASHCKHNASKLNPSKPRSVTYLSIFSWLCCCCHNKILLGGNFPTLPYLSIARENILCIALFNFRYRTPTKHAVCPKLRNFAVKMNDDLYKVLHFFRQWAAATTQHPFCSPLIPHKTRVACSAQFVPLSQSLTWNSQKHNISRGKRIWFWLHDSCYEPRNSPIHNCNFMLAILTSMMN